MFSVYFGRQKVPLDVLHDTYDSSLYIPVLFLSSDSSSHSFSLTSQSFLSLFLYSICLHLCSMNTAPNTCARWWTFSAFLKFAFLLMSLRFLVSVSCFRCLIFLFFSSIFELTVLISILFQYPMTSPTQSDRSTKVVYCTKKL